MNAHRKSIEHSRIGPRAVRPIDMPASAVAEYAALSGIGIDLSDRHVRAMMEAHGFDANDVGIAPTPLSPLGAPSIPAQLSFLQTWLPGFVRAITAVRKIDELIGVSTIGAWEDEEIVQGMLEPAGLAVPYTDAGNIPLASWNLSYERRTVIRFEQGFAVGVLEEARTSRMNVSTSAEKRAAAAVALDMQRNRVGFYGYNGGANRTYGLLNDPAMPAYVAVPNGASGSPLWSNKTMQEIIRDIRVGLARLRVQSQGNIDPKKNKITILLPLGSVDFLSVGTDFGVSAADWLRTNYPNVRVESAPELQDANGGASAMYIYAETVDDGSTDDNRTIVQMVPTKFKTVGVERRAKAYVEDFSNATAGVMTKRPYAMVRYTGI